MAMELRHEFTVPADREQTWAAFNDIESVALCFPGAAVTSVEGDTFLGTCKVKLGPIALVYTGTGTFVEKDEGAGRMVIDAKGKDKRGNGTAGAHVVATITAQGSATHVEVLTDLNITGKPAQFGRGVMQDVSDKLLGQFVACLEQKLTAPPEPEPEPVLSGGADVAEATAQASAAADAATSRAKVAQESAPPSSAATRPQPVAGGNNDALDLGATVLPVLAKAYWKHALGVVVVLVVLRRLLGRRRG
ncbi:MAG: SRPBCC family protein [Marmoricola sp.]